MFLGPSECVVTNGTIMGRWGQGRWHFHRTGGDLQSRRQSGTARGIGDTPFLCHLVNFRKRNLPVDTQLALTRGSHHLIEMSLLPLVTFFKVPES